MLLLYICSPEDVLAVEIYHDDFTNLSKVDTVNTTADIDVTAGWVSLPKQPLPSAIDVRAAGWEDAIASTNGVEVYTYDDATGAKIKNIGLSIPQVNDASGVACRDDAPALWSLTPSSLTLYRFSDGSMQTSPSLTVTGLSGVLSASTWEGLDKVVLLVRSLDNKGRIDIYREVAESVNLYLTLDTGLSNPVAVSVVPGTPDFLYATSTGVYYYMYDDATGGFLLHPAKQASDLTNLRSVSARDEESFLVAEGNDANFYFWKEPVGVSKVPKYSIEELSDLLSVSIKPRENEYATLTASGQQDYWMLEDSTGGMTKNSVLSRSGITLNLQYLSPAEYRSVAFPTTSNYDTVRVTAVTEVPTDTALTFYVSSDGGATWLETSNGGWIPVTAGDSFVVKAVLSTSNPGKTPKILSLKLEASVLEVENLKVLAVAANNPDQVLPSDDFPVSVRMGAMIQFEVQSSGFAESAWASFSLGEGSNMVPLYIPVEDNETNVWRGSYVVPEDTVEGYLLEVTVTVEKGGVKRSLTESSFIRVQGSVLDIVSLILTR